MKTIRKIAGWCVFGVCSVACIIPALWCFVWYYVGAGALALLKVDSAPEDTNVYSTNVNSTEDNTNVN